VLWLLLPELPWPAVAAAAMVTGVFSPMLNSTVITTRTMRTPPFLRASVHAAAVTVALVLAPLGALAAGPLLDLFGLDVAIAAVLILNTLCGIAFVAAGLRERATLKLSPLTPEEARLVVDGEHEPADTGVPARVGRRGD
jgi:hypothetical protein